MDWLLLAAGEPKIDPRWSWDEWWQLPRPLEFFRALFLAHAELELSKWHITYQYAEPRDFQITEGFYGTVLTGLYIREDISLATSMVPQQAQTETYGLADMQLVWHHAWVKSGQAYYFKHRWLKAQFADLAAQATFARIWQSIYHLDPVFEETTSPFE